MRERTEQRNEFKLGKRMTREVAAKENGGTAVLSVRVAKTDLQALEEKAEASGKTLAQLVREAINSFSGARDVVADETYSVSFTGCTFTHGPVRTQGSFVINRWKEGAQEQEDVALV